VHLYDGCPSGDDGYGVNPEHHGHHYAARACRLLLLLARRHGFQTLWITRNPDTGSRGAPVSWPAPSWSRSWICLKTTTCTRRVNAASAAIGWNDLSRATRGHKWAGLRIATGSQGSPHSCRERCHRLRQHAAGPAHPLFYSANVEMEMMGIARFRRRRLRQKRARQQMPLTFAGGTPEIAASALQISGHGCVIRDVSAAIEGEGIEE